MRKLETVIYKGEDGSAANMIYDLLCNHKNHRVPVRITDAKMKIIDSNVWVSKVVKHLINGKYIVSIKYKHK